jgi:hypothetical protein
MLRGLCPAWQKCPFYGPSRSLTEEERGISSPVSIGAVGIRGQPWAEVSRPVRVQRAVSSEP